MGGLTKKTSKEGDEGSGSIASSRPVTGMKGIVTSLVHGTKKLGNRKIRHTLERGD